MSNGTINPIIRDVSDITKFSLWTDYLNLDAEGEKETPISIAIVAVAESGKTSITDQFYPNKGIKKLGELTAWGIQHKYIKDMQSGNIRRLYIPDLINCTSKKVETVNTLISFLNSYISWEGVSSIATYAMQLTLDTPLRGSLMTTIATKDFLRVSQSLSAVGFLSRLVIVAFQYTQDQANEILETIAQRDVIWENYDISFPDELIEVNIDPEMARQLMYSSKKIGVGVGGYGARAMHQLMMLARGRALSEGRDNVTPEDIQHINYLASEYMGRIPYMDNKSGLVMYRPPVWD